MTHRYISVKLTDENDEEYGVKHTDNKPIVSVDGFGDTLSIEGSVIKIHVHDDTSQQLLGGILKELKIINLHLSLITDTLITSQEVE